MIKFKFGRISLMILSVLFVGALVGSSFGAVMSAEAATSLIVLRLQGRQWLHLRVHWRCGQIQIDRIQVQRSDTPSIIATVRSLSALAPIY